MRGGLKQLIEAFDASYVISLADRVDRQKAVGAEFQQLGVQIPGPKVEFLLAQRPQTSGSFPGRGYRGSFSSHRRVLEMAKARQLSNVLVFEDDVSFRKVKTKDIDRIRAALYGVDWDVIYFGYLSPVDAGLVGPLHSDPPDTIGGHFYAVNARFLEPMIAYMYACEARPRDHPEGGPMGRDGVFNHVRYVRPETKVFLAVPNLAVQRSSRTDLHPLNPLDRSPVLEPIMSGLRSLKHAAWLQIDKVRL